MSTVIGILFIILAAVSLFSLIGGLVNPSSYDKKKEDGTIEKKSRSRIFVSHTMLIFVFSTVSMICLAPDEVEESSDAEVVEKTNKAVSDSIAMYEGITKRTSYAKKSFLEASREFDVENYARAKEILKNIPSIQGVGEVSIMPIYKNERRNPILDDAWATQSQLNGLGADIHTAQKEIEYASKNWLRYPKGSLERMFEMIILEWHISRVVAHKAPVFDYSFIRSGMRKSIIKDIEFSNSKLSVSMRTDPDYFLDLNYRERRIDFQHPLKFMGNFRRLVINMWRSSWDYNKEKYSKVSEIEFSFYYHSERGTETLIAQFGLTRNAVQPVNFTKLRTKDGTFQDFVKQNGTYWLHRDIPDLGTPVHLLSRRRN